MTALAQNITPSPTLQRPRDIGDTEDPSRTHSPGNSGGRKWSSGPACDGEAGKPRRLPESVFLSSPNVVCPQRSLQLPKHLCRLLNSPLKLGTKKARSLWVEPRLPLS